MIVVYTAMFTSGLINSTKCCNQNGHNGCFFLTTSQCVKKCYHPQHTPSSSGLHSKVNVQTINSVVYLTFIPQSVMDWTSNTTQHARLSKHDSASTTQQARLSKHDSANRREITLIQDEKSLYSWFHQM